MKRLALAIVFVLGFAPSAWADFQAGVAAYDRGDYATALREFRPLAEQGYVEAQFSLARLYHGGRGVPHDLEQAARWYRRAAEQGKITAQVILAGFYEYGVGVSKDMEKAFGWYRRAAAAGNPEAAYLLGALFARGSGVPQNYAQAVEWYRRSIKGGPENLQYSAALHALARAFESGAGVRQDYVEAHKFYNLAGIAAAKSGNADMQRFASETLTNLSGLMTPAQIAEAQRLAREWKPKKVGLSD